jgi:electron transfer flavoprotein alpha subunit
VAAVLVHIDLDGDRPDPASLMALAAGRHVASSWGATLYAAVIVHGSGGDPSASDTARVATSTHVPGLEPVERALARGGADKVVVAETTAPVAPLWAAVGTAWQRIIDHLRPRLVLFGADAPSASELAPRTAARIGARFLARARAQGGDVIELRDRDGGYARAIDGGAAVALVGRAEPAPLGDEDVDVVVLSIPSELDPRIEIAGTTPAEVSHTSGALDALGDDVADDPQIAADAKKLAALLGAQLVGSKAAASVVQPGAFVDRTTPLAPDLAIAIGNTQLDLAGSTSLVRIGTPAGKTADAAVPGSAKEGLADLVKRLEAL